MPQNSILCKLASSQVDYDLNGKWGMTAWAWSGPLLEYRQGWQGLVHSQDRPAVAFLCWVKKRLLVKILLLRLLLGLDTCRYVWQILESFPKKIFRLGEEGDTFWKRINFKEKWPSMTSQANGTPFLTLEGKGDFVLRQVWHLGCLLCLPIWPREPRVISQSGKNSLQTLTFGSTLRPLK